MVAFKNFPKLSVKINNLIVLLGPYLVLIGGVLNILAIFSVFSAGQFIFYSFNSLTNFNPLSYYIYIITTVLSGIMLIFSFKDLQEKKLFGWQLVFWSFNLSILTSFLTINIFGGILIALVSWYFLSQIRYNYS